MAGRDSRTIETRISDTHGQRSRVVGALKNSAAVIAEAFVVEQKNGAEQPSPASRAKVRRPGRRRVGATGISGAAVVSTGARAASAMGSTHPAAAARPGRRSAVPATAAAASPAAHNAARDWRCRQSERNEGVGRPGKPPERRSRSNSSRGDRDYG